MIEKKYACLLEDADVRRWYENVARGSRVTADVYLRRLGSFCSQIGKSPKEFVGLDDREIKNVLMDFVSRMEAEGYAGGYISTVVKAVRSWLSFNDREIKFRLKIKGAEDTPTLKDERVPTKEELRKIFLSGDKKTRAACVLVAHSGLRIEVLGNYSGDDGLRVKDFPEMRIENGRVVFDKVPTMVVVRKELSKARHQYFTFLSEEGCEYLRDYLEERIRKGEKLTPESAIITPKVKMKEFIKAINVGDIIRSAIRKAGFPWRPYVLRSYFDTQLMLAESKGIVLRDYRVFWMGHKGDIENRYTTNKQKLPPDVIEDMRESYRKAQELLQTTVAKEEMSREEILATFNRQFLIMLGYSEKEIEKLGDLSKLTSEQMKELVKNKSMQALGLNGNTQKVVKLSEVKQWILQGWEYVTTLPPDEAIIRLPKS
ncbi:MAG: site-specific integrase [Nitrososphaeria archaeon]